MQIEVLTVKWNTINSEILLIKAGKIFKKGKKTTWVGEGDAQTFIITIHKGSGIWEIQPSQRKGNSAS